MAARGCEEHQDICINYATLKQEVGHMDKRLEATEKLLATVAENQWNPKIVAALVALCGTICTTAGAVLSVYLQKAL